MLHKKFLFRTFLWNRIIPGYKDPGKYLVAMVVHVQLEHTLRSKQTVQLKLAVGQDFGFVPVNVERFVNTPFDQQIEIYAHFISLFH